MRRKKKKGLFKRIYAYFKNKIFTFKFLSVLYAAFALISTIYFFIGYHNMDMGQNMRYLESELNIELLDRTNKGNLLTGVEAYILGVKYMFLSFITFGGSCFLAGMQYGKAK